MDSGAAAIFWRSALLRHCVVPFAGCKTPPMEAPAAIAQIRQACKNIGLELMRIHPAVPALANKETQDELYKILFEITKEVEVIKKRLAKLEAGTDTPEL